MNGFLILLTITFFQPSSGKVLFMAGQPTHYKSVELCKADNPVNKPIPMLTPNQGTVGMVLDCIQVKTDPEPAAVKK